MENKQRTFFVLLLFFTASLNAHTTWNLIDVQPSIYTVERCIAKGHDTLYKIEERNTTFVIQSFNTSGIWDTLYTSDLPIRVENVQCVFIGSSEVNGLVVFLNSMLF